MRHLQYAIIVALLAFNTGLLTSINSNNKEFRKIPVHAHTIDLEYALGQRVFVPRMDSSQPDNHELVPGVVIGWGVSDWMLKGQDEIAYFVMTGKDHSAHGYKADEIQPEKK